jgi:molybdate transport system substrate-binding protein
MKNELPRSKLWGIGGNLSTTAASSRVLDPRRINLWLAILLACLLTLLAGGVAQALTIAAGAGYRRPVDELSRRFQADTGIKVDLVFGNMGQVTGQIRAGAPVDLVLGDQTFLKKFKSLYSAITTIGKGRLVLAYPRGMSLRSPRDLAQPRIKRLAMPDQAKAIYGKAGQEFLTRSGLAAAVRDKLLIVGTVPQVSAYLLSGEVDAGLLNLTDALAIKNRIGGYLEIAPQLYDPIKIVVGLLTKAPQAEQAQRFLQFLASPGARKILESHGL